MPLTANLRKQLIECLRRVISPSRLQAVTVEYDDIKIKYEEDTPHPDSPFRDRVVFFVDELVKNRTEILFIKILKKEYPEQTLVLGLYDQMMQDIVLDQNGKYSFNPDHFDCSMIRDSLPFVDRREVKEAIYEMVHGNRNRVLILRGASRCGISYLRYYLGLIGELLECFSFKKIDLKRIVYEDLVFAKDIALELASNVNFQNSSAATDAPKHLFKISPFINELRAHLDASPATPTKHLIFIDQFDAPQSNDVDELILRLIEMMINESDSCYLLLGGFDYDLLDFDMQMLTEVVDLSPFTRTHLQEYLPKLYQILSKQFSVAYSEEEFVQLIEEHLMLPDLLQPGQNNVEPIGKGLAEFYDNYKKENAA